MQELTCACCVKRTNRAKGAAPDKADVVDTGNRSECRRGVRVTQHKQDPSYNSCSGAVGSLGAATMDKSGLLSKSDKPRVRVPLPFIDAEPTDPFASLEPLTLEDEPADFDDMRPGMLPQFPSYPLHEGLISEGHLVHDDQGELSETHDTIPSPPPILGNH